MWPNGTTEISGLVHILVTVIKILELYYMLFVLQFVMCLMPPASKLLKLLSLGWPRDKQSMSVILLPLTGANGEEEAPGTLL